MRDDIQGQHRKKFGKWGVASCVIASVLMVALPVACVLYLANYDEGAQATDCTTAYDSAFDWEQEVRSRADLPDTFERNRPWFGVRPTSVLRSEHPGAEFMAFNFSIENLFGARVTHHSVAAFSPPPACRLLEVWVFEGRLG